MKKVFLLMFISIFVSLISCGSNKDENEIKVNKSNLKEANKNHSEKEKKEPDIDTIVPHSGNIVITSKEVKSHIGDSLTIKGYVADIFLSEKVAYLNFENKFPKNIFACAIFSSDLDSFGDLSKYKGKTVRVSGRISTYKSKPQVILKSPEQIKITD